MNRCKTRPPSLTYRALESIIGKTVAGNGACKSGVGRNREDRTELDRIASSMLAMDQRIHSFLDRRIPDVAPERAETFKESMVGRYRIEDVLGSGGTATVYKARDVASGALAAVKLLDSRLRSSDDIARFARERRLHEGVDSGFVPRILSAGVTRDVPWFAMDHVDGMPITRFARQHRLALGERVLLLCQLLLAVIDVHDHGIVHRDIKAGNVMVDTRGQLKLLDFGASAFADAPIAAGDTAEPAMHCLTLDVASPEQLAGEYVGYSSDTFQAGVLLFELLAGRRPRRLPDGDLECVDRALLGAAESVSADGPLDGTAAGGRCRKEVVDLAKVISKATSKRSSSRYESARAFLADLRGWQATHRHTQCAGLRP